MSTKAICNHQLSANRRSVPKLVRTAQMIICKCLFIINRVRTKFTRFCSQILKFMLITGNFQTICANSLNLEQRTRTSKQQRQERAPIPKQFLTKSQRNSIMATAVLKVWAAAELRSSRWNHQDQQVVDQKVQDEAQPGTRCTWKHQKSTCNLMEQTSCQRMLWPERKSKECKEYTQPIPVIKI